MTAVEWFADKIDDIIHDGLRERVELLKEQAKQMEKQQIIDAYMDRMDCTDKEHWSKIIGEQYYNETFGGTTQKQALQFLADQAQELNMGYENELSDMDIKKGIKKEWTYSNYQDRHWMEEGAKWYREQLKKK